jgi:hypothetical protein
MKNNVVERFVGHEQRVPALCAAEYLSLGQGLFYLATGAWPLLNMRTFEQVTGPKTDKWLVKTAGVLIMAIGGALTLAGLRRNVRAETRVLAVASAVGLTAIDVVYVSKRRISPVYLGTPQPK